MFGDFTLLVRWQRTLACPGNVLLKRSVEILPRCARQNDMQLVDAVVFDRTTSSSISGPENIIAISRFGCAASAPYFG